MRKEPIRVAIWGLGAMGSGMAKMLLSKQGVEIVGVCDLHPDRVNRSLCDVLGVGRAGRRDVVIDGDIDRILAESGCEICLCATDSFVKNAFPKLKRVLESGVNVISTAEEMAFPAAQNPELAEALDAIAKEHGVSILGTGINPGLIMDLLVVAMTGCMTDVTHIEARRVNSLSPFGKAVMEEQGVGLTPDAFDAGVSSGKIAGHVGFSESIRMIADGIGWEVERIEQQMQPIITGVDRQAPYGYAAAGNVAGVNMTGQGYVDGSVRIDMIHPQQIEPETEGTSTGDYITIKGSPEVNLSISPEVDGGLGTIAMCVNMIPHVLNASPGLKTMLDLPVPRAIMGDMRRFVGR